MRPILAIATWATCVLAASAAEWRPIGSTNTWTKDGGISWRGGCALRFSPEQRIAEERQAEQQQCRDSCAAKPSCSHYNWSQGKCSLLCGTAAERKELLQQEDACGVKQNFDASGCPGAYDTTDASDTTAVSSPAPGTDPYWKDDGDFLRGEGCVFNSRIFRTLPSKMSPVDCRIACSAERYCTHYNWHNENCQLLCGDLPKKASIQRGSYVCGFPKIRREESCGDTTTAGYTTASSSIDQETLEPDFLWPSVDWWHKGCKYDSQILRTLPSSVSADYCRASCNAEYFCSHFNWHGGSCKLLCGDVPRTFQIKGSAFICGNIKGYRGRTCSADSTAVDEDATTADHITTTTSSSISRETTPNSYWKEDANFWMGDGCEFDSQILRTIPSSVSADDCRASCNAEYFCSHFNWKDGSCELLCGLVPTTATQQPDKLSTYACGNIKVYRVASCQLKRFNAGLLPLV